MESIDSLKKWDTTKFFKKLAEFKFLNTPASEFSPSFYDDGIYYIIEKGDEETYRSRNINLIENKREHEDELTRLDESIILIEFDRRLPMESRGSYLLSDKIQITLAHANLHKN